MIREIKKNNRPNIIRQEGKTMIKAVIFDMFETLITHYNCPLYFGLQIAADAGIPVEKFLASWHPTESDRSTGKLSLETVLEQILKENNCYSEELLHKIVKKRIVTKKACFEKPHPEIIPMLSALKEKGMKIGLISNCYSEEVSVIRNSVLKPYFDVMCLSYEEKLQKPDRKIFERCVEKLGVKPEECVYIGDGGSNELVAAKAFGMRPAQAVWYFKEGSFQAIGRSQEFPQLEKPLDVLEFIEIFGGLH